MPTVIANNLSAAPGAGRWQRRHESVAHRAARPSQALPVIKARSAVTLVIAADARDVVK